MSDENEGDEGGQDVTSDQAQQLFFGNERSNPEATRPPLGTQTDPMLPGTPTPGHEDFEVPAKPTNEQERGDKL